MRHLLAFVACAGTMFPGELSRSDFRGWSCYRLDNGIITVEIAPEQGGRIAGFELAGHQFLWTNPQLAGKHAPASGLGPKGEWLNWGGDKLWPAPQGWDGPEQWPGPPDAVLDGSPHTVQMEGRGALRLTSAADPRSGIRFSRAVSVEDRSSIIHIRASMTNVDTKPRRWGIWSVTQLDCGNRGTEGFNPRFHAYIPINRKSRFPEGYTVLFGDRRNPQFVLDSRRDMLTVHYQHRVGKVALDSDGGWLANVDGTTGFVFVQTFRFVPAVEYPDGSSVEYWTNGLGKIFAWGRETVMPEGVAENPFVAETELVSPYVTIAPGEQGDFSYEWRATNIGGDYSIIGCSEAACIAEPLTATRTGSRTVRFGGRFGVFYQGDARLQFIDSAGQPVGMALSRPVSPSAVLLAADFGTGLEVPPRAASVVVAVYRDGRKLAELARAPIRMQ